MTDEEDRIAGLESELSDHLSDYRQWREVDYDNLVGQVARLTEKVAALEELTSILSNREFKLLDEESEGHSIIRPMTGYDVFDMAQAKMRERNEEGIALTGHSAHDAFIIKMSQRECDCGHKGHEHHGKGYSCERCECPAFDPIMKIEPPDEMALACANCPHIKGRHYRGGKPYCVPANGECKCPGFTTRVVQFPSYSQSVQSEPQPQYEERQASFHSRCKGQHDRIVVALLAHTVNTLGSDPRAEPEKLMEQLSRLLLAQWTCEEVECQVFRRLAEQALSSLLLVSGYYRRTRTGSQEQSSQ